MSAKKIQNDSGFSLLEIMVALAILSFGMLGTAALIGGVARGNMISKNITVATTLAEDKMEEVMRLGYSGMPSSDTSTTEDYNSISNFLAYKRVTKTYIDNPMAKMKKIVVEVNWESGSQPVILTAFFAR